MGGLGAPGFWVDGAGGGGFSAACRKALAACGIDPDAFGNYTQRLKAGNKARNDYRQKLGKNRKNHDPSCNYRKTGGNLGRCGCFELPAAKPFYKKNGDAFLLANSQSGHEGQNAFSQNTRGDPCSNVPPPNAKQTGDGGSYGYDDTKAGCTDHYGKSTDPGTTHYEVTRAEEEYTQTIQASTGGRVSGDAIQQGVEQTARIAAEGPSPGGARAPDTKEGKDRAKAFAKAQSDQAAVLSEREGTKPNSECSAKQKKKNQDKAVECMVAHWKMMIDKMRMDAIDQHSTAANSTACDAAIAEQNAQNAAARKKNKSKDPEDVDRFSQLSPELQMGVVAATEKETAARQKALQANATSGEKGDGNKKPSMDDCREYQANWLATAGWGENGNGASLPDFSGRKPGPDTSTTNNRTSGGGTSR